MTARQVRYILILALLVLAFALMVARPWSTSIEPTPAPTRIAWLDLTEPTSERLKTFGPQGIGGQQ